MELKEIAALIIWLDFSYFLQIQCLLSSFCNCPLEKSAQSVEKLFKKKDGVACTVAKKVKMIFMKYVHQFGKSSQNSGARKEAVNKFEDDSSLWLYLCFILCCWPRPSAIQIM
jgi:hypothetical protein